MESQESLQTVHKRELCARCKRSTLVCICAGLPADAPFPTRTRVILLQHPSEAKKKVVSTVPLIRLALSNCELIAGNGKFSEKTHPGLGQVFSSRKTLVLFPSRDAIPLELFATAAHRLKLQEEASGGDEASTTTPVVDEVDPFASLTEVAKARLKEAVEMEGPFTILALDGTWSQAKRMLSRSPHLVEAIKSGAITPVQFHSGIGGEYIFRREPAPHCLSTLEAVARALALLEPTEEGRVATKALLGSFRMMVQHQVKYIQKAMELDFDKVKRKAESRHKKMIDIPDELPGLAGLDDAPLLQFQGSVSDPLAYLSPQQVSALHRQGDGIPHKPSLKSIDNDPIGEYVLATCVRLGKQQVELTAVSDVIRDRRSVAQAACRAANVSRPKGLKLTVVAAKSIGLRGGAPPTEKKIALE